MARLYSLKPNAVEDAERREDVRIDIAIWGRIRLRNGDAHPARFCNLSQGGFMAMTPVGIRRYAEIDVEIPAIGWRSAMAAWTEDDRVGGEFEPPLEPGILDRLMSFRKE